MDEDGAEYAVVIIAVIVWCMVLFFVFTGTGAAHETETGLYTSTEFPIPKTKYGLLKPPREVYATWTDKEKEIFRNTSNQGPIMFMIMMGLMAAVALFGCWWADHTSPPGWDDRSG